MQRFKNPYKCPICGELSCYGVHCGDCQYDPDKTRRDCDEKVKCNCDTDTYITSIFQLKETINIKETEIISLILQNKVLKQQIKDMERLEELSKLKSIVLGNSK